MKGEIASPMSSLPKSFTHQPDRKIGEHSRSANSLPRRAVIAVCDPAQGAKARLLQPGVRCLRLVRPFENGAPLALLGGLLGLGRPLACGETERANATGAYDRDRLPARA